MRVHTDPILANVVLVKHVLEAQGISCEVRRASLSSAIGEIPTTEAWPELWVSDDARVDEAKVLVAEALKPADDLEAWVCPSCQESVDGHFAACWNCATERR